MKYVLLIRSGYLIKTNKLYCTILCMIDLVVCITFFYEDAVNFCLTCCICNTYASILRFLIHQWAILDMCTYGSCVRLYYLMLHWVYCEYDCTSNPRSLVYHIKRCSWWTWPWILNGGYVVNGCKKGRVNVKVYINHLNIFQYDDVP